MNVESGKSPTIKPKTININKEDLKLIVEQMLILTPSIIMGMTSIVSSEYINGLCLLIC